MNADQAIAEQLGHLCRSVSICGCRCATTTQPPAWTATDRRVRIASVIGKVVRMAWVPRERVQAALEFRPVDVPPLQIHPSPAGLFEHGQKLVDLMRRCGHDFGPLDDVSVPSVPPEDFDDDGRYHKIETDAWGTTWEYRSATL